MSKPPTQKFTISDLRKARETGAKVPMLTCYDYTTARYMSQAGVPTLLVGDSAGNVILGHESTLPVSLSFMIEITAAVRRGAPHALLIADLPFGTYQASAARGAANAFRLIQKSGCDGVKLEVTQGHTDVVGRLAAAGVVVIAHLGLRPQSVSLLGGYHYQGRTAVEAENIVRLACQMETAGAAAILLEAVPPEVSAAVVKATQIPVIGCGAGPACHAHVVVTHDALGLTPRTPRFVPPVGDLAGPLTTALAEYARIVTSGEYPTPQQQYEMPPDEKLRFLREGAI